MKTIPKPKIKARDVFTACIGTVDDPVLKKNLSACTTLIEAGEKDLEDKIQNSEVYKISPNLIVLGTIGKKEMKVVYDYRMVRIAPGNLFYNQIKSSAPHDRCPLCSVRKVDTLDHYLPKSKFPLYAITPINLIPSCFQCNKGKLIDFPKTSEEQSLHPYYDNVETESWVKAKILHTNPIGFEYYAAPPATWTKLLKERAVNHFNSFDLNDLFATHANEEYRGIKNQLINLYKSHPDLLKEHLLECYKSRLMLGINSWQAIMYKALLDDAWFFSVGIMQ